MARQPETRTRPKGPGEQGVCQEALRTSATREGPPHGSQRGRGHEHCWKSSKVGSKAVRMGWDGLGKQCVNLECLASASHRLSPIGSQRNREPGVTVTENRGYRAGQGTAGETRGE